jgi:LPXTG-motif cell wall-anchored protein
MRQMAIVTPPSEPPVVEPVPEQPISPVVPEPVTAATPPAAAAPEVVEAAPIAVARPSELPATGSSVSVILVLAGLLVAVGSTVAGFARRTSSAS